jgi:tRNA pseudouridine55 synthase
MDGVVVVDKPHGVTSHDVVAVARRALRETRIGHTGTLDPLATGVLPLACGRATRLVRFLSAADKEYEAVVRFGVTTDSYDVTGRELARTGLVPEMDAIQRALDSLRGEYDQMPPAFSAKRVGSRRAYALARRDEPVELEPVRVRVSQAEMRSYEPPLARIAITCSAGFYVRSFAHELGRLTGAGACLEHLRRTRSGDFELDRAVTLDCLVEQPAAAFERAVPLDELLPRMPAVSLSGEGRSRVKHGREIEPAQIVGHTAGTGDWVRLRDSSGHLLAVGRAGARPGTLHPAVVLI